MPIVSLIAVKRWKQYAPGQTFQIEAKHAHVLRVLGIAKDVPHTPEPRIAQKALSADPESYATADQPPADAVKRTYKRRDMKAEGE